MQQECSALKPELDTGQCTRATSSWHIILVMTHPSTAGRGCASLDVWRTMKSVLDKQMNSNAAASPAHAHISSVSTCRSGLSHIVLDSLLNSTCISCKASESPLSYNASKQMEENGTQCICSMYTSPLATSCGELLLPASREWALHELGHIVGQQQWLRMMHGHLKGCKPH